MLLFDIMKDIKEVYMISLIAVDMDGTLLDSSGKIPQHFHKVYKRLDKEDILFCVASGRQYFSLLNSFTALRDKIVFIAENGANVVYKGETLYMCPIPRQDVREIYEKVNMLPDSLTILCGRKAAYIIGVEPLLNEYSVEIEKYYPVKKYIHSLDEVDDDIFKFSVCTLGGSEKISLPFFTSFAERYSVIVSGELWLDIAQPGINKGVAIAHVQEYFGIAQEETMAFGDFLNDIELLQNAQYSYAMANAHPDLFQHANFQAAANYEDGVLRQITDMLDHPEEYEYEYEPDSAANE